MTLQPEFNSERVHWRRKINRHKSIAEIAEIVFECVNCIQNRKHEKKESNRLSVRCMNAIQNINLKKRRRRRRGKFTKTKQNLTSDFNRAFYLKVQQNTECLCVSVRAFVYVCVCVFNQKIDLHWKWKKKSLHKNKPNRAKFLFTSGCHTDGLRIFHLEQVFLFLHLHFGTSVYVSGNV